MSPGSRIVLSLALLTVAGLVLAAALVFAALDGLRVRAAESNTAFVLTQLRNSVESRLSLGLTLPEVRAAQDAIERERAGNPDILAIEIFSSSGVSVFNTDRGSVGEAITDTWREAIRRRDDDGRWRVGELGALVVGETIRNDFGEPVGEIAVTLSGGARQSHAETLAATLLPRLGVLGLAGAIFVALIAAAVFSLASRDFAVAARILTYPTPDDSEGDSDLARSARAMRVHVEETMARIDAAITAVRRIDEDEERDAAA
jgi:hypothetical protein